MIGHFFDIPVYRLPEARYYVERKQFVDRTIYNDDSAEVRAMREFDAQDPNARAAFKDHLQRTFGGCWRFNEVIGYIRLHFLGSQVRGEYFAVRRKRIVRTRTKTLEYITHKLAPEVDIEPPITDASVLLAIEKYLAACRKELPGRFVDTELFTRVAKHIKWKDLFFDM